MIGANVINVGLNYVLIFDASVCPRSGPVGAGISTGVVRVLMGTVGAGVDHRPSAPCTPARGSRGRGARARPCQALAAIAGVGAGIGFQLKPRDWAFQAAMLFAG